MSLIRPVTRADIKGPALYAPIRDDYRKRVIELKVPRRALIGDRVSMVFENRHTLTLQVEEMVRAESITSEEGIRAELEVYNALMPTADSLSATLFIELPPDADAYVELKRLVGLDEHLQIHIGNHAIRAAFEEGRSTADKISAVQYVRFPLSAEARAALTTAGTPLVLEIDHPNYLHKVVLGEATRASLAGDYLAGHHLAGDGLAGDGLAGDGLAGDGLAGDGLAGDGLAGDGLAGDGLAGDGKE